MNWSHLTLANPKISFWSFFIQLICFKLNGLLSLSSTNLLPACWKGSLVCQGGIVVLHSNKYLGLGWKQQSAPGFGCISTATTYLTSSQTWQQQVINTFPEARPWHRLRPLTTSGNQYYQSSTPLASSQTSDNTWCSILLQHHARPWWRLRTLATHLVLLQYYFRP